MEDCMIEEPCRACGRVMCICEPEYDDYDPDERGICNTCGGTGVYSTCIDDLCHGGECIHGDDSSCPDCDGDY